MLKFNRFITSYWHESFPIVYPLRKPLLQKFLQACAFFVILTMSIVIFNSIIVEGNKYFENFYQLKGNEHKYLCFLLAVCHCCHHRLEQQRRRSVLNFNRFITSYWHESFPNVYPLRNPLLYNFL